MDKEQRKAGAQDADPDPEGGKGYEPAPVNGEGTGYNMKEVAEKTSTPSEGKKENAGEGAGVQDVE